MERLTEQGVIYKSLDFMEDGIYEFINRLSAYEDTGLTPEEVKDLQKRYENMLEWKDYYYGKWSNADEKLKEIDKDRDYWKAEALKHCAKLGEIKLLVGRAE